MTGRALVVAAAAVAAAAVAAVAGCETPETDAVFANGYPAPADGAIYDAFWLNVRLPAPLAVGEASAPLAVPQTSGTTAYALLAPGYDPTSPSPPTRLLALESVAPYPVDLGDTMTITIDDTAFAGDCVAGKPLDQADADFITQRVFATTFAGLSYDAATCTTTSP
jgi:hypothetical protein